MKKRYHYADKYLINPTHPITVVLAGCGGTGCRVLTALGMMHVSLEALGHPGFHVAVYDGDTVQRSNIGRQLFYECDLGLNKAIALVTRLNRSFGTAWSTVPKHFNKESSREANIYVSCVDNVQARIEMSELFRNLPQNNYYNPYSKPMYWIDYGNRQKTGQVVLGTLNEIEQPKSRKYKTISKLPRLDERFDLSQIDDRDSGPSCSHAQALAKQDLFINTSLATLGCHILWELIKEGRTDKAGLYLNLENLRSNAIFV